MAAKSLYTTLTDNLWLLRQRLKMIDSYINEPEKWLGTIPVYDASQKEPLIKLIEETEAAVAGIEYWRATKVLPEIYKK